MLKYGIGFLYMGRTGVRLEDGVFVHGMEC